MTIEQMRSFVSGLYSGRWQDRVRKMSDNQILAIYQRFINSKQQAYEKAEQELRNEEIDILPSQYETCKICGANLDFDERCDCNFQA